VTFDQHATSIVAVLPPFVDNDPLAEYGGFLVPPHYFWWKEKQTWVRISIPLSASAFHELIG
jgi:hypothetical protein